MCFLQDQLLGDMTRPLWIWQPITTYIHQAYQCSNLPCPRNRPHRVLASSPSRPRQASQVFLSRASQVFYPTNYTLILVMERLTQLEGYVEQLTEAVKKLADLSRSIGPEQLLTASDADKDVTNTRATILATVAGIKMLVGAPTDFLQNLASQVPNCPFSPSRFFP